MKKITLFLALVSIAYTNYAQCEFTAPYSENFDAVSAPDLPPCWSGLYDSDWGEFVRTSTYNYSAPNSLEIKSGDNSTGNEVIAVTPEFIDLDSNKQIRFFVKKQANVGTSLYIGTMSDPTNQNTFTEIHHITSSELPYDSWQEFTITFENYNTTDHYIAFKHGRESVGQSIVIDDFVYEYQPCYKSAPYSENFDAVSAPDLPPCWSGLNDSDWGEFVRTSTYNYSAPNSLEIKSGDNSTGNEVIAVSPEFVDLDSNKQIRFFVKKQANVGTSLYIGTMSDPTNQNTFTEIHHITTSELPYDSWQEFTITFENYNNTDHYIAFKHGRESVGQSIGIDDFVYEQNPNIGFKDIAFSSLTIYPNPASDILKIKASDIVTKAVIYSSLGQKIMEVNPNDVSFILEVQSLKNGLYFLEIKGNRKKSFSKFYKI